MGVALVRAFYYIVQNHSPHEAFKWLMEVCGVFFMCIVLNVLLQAQSAENVNSKDGVATFFSSWYQVDVEEVLGENTLYEQLRKVWRR